MSKKIKEMELAALRKSFQGITNFAMVAPVKVDSATDAEFRRTLRSKKIKVKMIKNSLAKRVLTESGVQMPDLTGVTLLCWGGESVKELTTAVEAAVKDSKKDPKAPDKYKIAKDAIADGVPVPFDIAKTLPTRQEAIGNVIAALMGPGSSLAAALTGPATQLAGILKAIEEKGEGEKPAA